MLQRSLQLGSLGRWRPLWLPGLLGSGLGQTTGGRMTWPRNNTVEVWWEIAGKRSLLGNHALHVRHARHGLGLEGKVGHRREWWDLGHHGGSTGSSGGGHVTTPAVRQVHVYKHNNNIGTLECLYMYTRKMASIFQKRASPSLYLCRNNWTQYEHIQTSMEFSAYNYEKI